MLRVYDGGCLWCPYVNEFTTRIGDIHHHVSDDTLPYRAINRIKTAVQMGGTLVTSWCGSTFIWLCDNPNGVYWRSSVYCLTSQGFLSCFCEYGFCWFDWCHAEGFITKTEYKQLCRWEEHWWPHDVAAFYIMCNTPNGVYRRSPVYCLTSQGFLSCF